MAQITLSVPDLQRLVEFCQANALENYFIAKDQGAYLGASMGAGNNVLFYFAGCNPDKDPDFYETSRAKFGGDDFGEQLKLSDLLGLLGRVHTQEEALKAQGKKFAPCRGIRWNITTRSISMKAI
jgi:hypothetical protein